MAIDWSAIATIASPIIALFVGVWVNRKFESRPVLISYYSHVAAFTYSPSPGLTHNVHTHSVVLRNAGHRAATNVRLHHTVLPDFNIWPPLVHHVDTLPDGSKDIVIPSLVPKEMITVSYLYLPPVTVHQVNAGIKCDQGFAHQIPVLLQQQYPRWLNIIAKALLLWGLVTAIYLLFQAVLRVLR